jgi:hypothetical protein
MPTRGLALGVLAIGSPLILLSFIVGGRFGELLFVLLAVTFPPAACAVGARPAGARKVTAGLALLLAASTAGLFMLGGRADAPPGGGLPAATWLMLLGVGLAPLLLVTVGYAATFRKQRHPPRGGSPAKPPSSGS